MRMMCIWYTEPRCHTVTCIMSRSSQKNQKCVRRPRPTKKRQLCSLVLSPDRALHTSEDGFLVRRAKQASAACGSTTGTEWPHGFNGLCGLTWPGLHDAGHGLLHVLNHLRPLQPRPRHHAKRGLIQLTHVLLTMLCNGMTSYSPAGKAQNFHMTLIANHR